VVLCFVYSVTVLATSAFYPLPYTTLFRSVEPLVFLGQRPRHHLSQPHPGPRGTRPPRPLSRARRTLVCRQPRPARAQLLPPRLRSEEHTSELQSRENLVCRLLLEKKKYKT